MKDSKAKYQKYKILHLTTGSYIRKFTYIKLDRYYLSDDPSIFEYKIPYNNMCVGQINKAIRHFTNRYKELTFNEFEIIEIDD